MHNSNYVGGLRSFDLVAISNRLVDVAIYEFELLTQRSKSYEDKTLIVLFTSLQKAITERATTLIGENRRTDSPRYHVGDLFLASASKGRFGVVISDNDHEFIPNP